MKILKTICRHWYNIGLAVAAAAAVVLAIFWKDMSVILRLNTISLSLCLFISSRNMVSRAENQ